ncbi:hypothetical protein [Aeromicrobium wangtongii]|uniref:DUF2567 domain-containing protein n=1 Tax=Aeromicrobium wangtongii TaxID=2969247 RepID=A0ABY5MAA2_9ACTN|nr:hypothetical protein [Aeromicrobium wangtongii]MCD9197572.1 hypothetical protein [Aeromicrobium wangtongii]UUP15064.1 hypothetical protein NQV15_07050 [Aeromicrobium wangtongii]
MNPSSPASHGRSALGAVLPARRMLTLALATLALGLAAGLVWLWLADPSQWQVSDRGILLTEAASRGQFQVVVMFVLVGLVVSLAAGWGIVQLLPDAGWLVVPVTIVATVLAALIAWRIGVDLGPPSPASVRDVQPGDTLPSRLAVDSVAPFLVWPIFGLLGVIGATWGADRRA